MFLLQMNAYKCTSGVSHYESYSLNCSETQIILLFSLECCENCALVWLLMVNLILHFTCIWTAESVFVTQAILSQMQKPTKKAIKEREMRYKHCLIAVALCLMFCTLPTGKNDLLLQRPMKKKIIQIQYQKATLDTYVFCFLPMMVKISLPNTMLLLIVFLYHKEKIRANW